MVEGFKEVLTKSCTYKCKEWEAGHAADTVGSMSGTSLDYMAHLAARYIGQKLEYALTIQLRSKDGEYVVGREEIRPSGEEQYEAVKWFLLHRGKRHGGQS